MPIQRIGLTGGIGSGKSTVAELLRQRGAHIVDTDAIARSLTGPGGEAIEPLRAAFGPAAIAADGSLDRPWMREHAFSSSGARATLEAILHPLIGRRAQALAAEAPAGTCVVFDVPLLVESGHWRDRVDRVLVIDCPEDVQIARVLRRPGWSREAAERVVAQQARRDVRRAAADAVIDNRGDTLPPLVEAVDRLCELWGIGASAPAI